MTSAFRAASRCVQAIVRRLIAEARASQTPEQKAPVTALSLFLPTRRGSA